MSEDAAVRAATEENHPGWYQEGDHDPLDKRPCAHCRIAVEAARPIIATGALTHHCIIYCQLCEGPIEREDR